MKVRDLINEVHSINSDAVLMEAIDVTAVKGAINDVLKKFEVPGIPLKVTAAYKAFADAYSRARGRKEYNSEEVEDVADQFTALQQIDLDTLVKKTLITDDVKKYVKTKLAEIKGLMSNLTKEDDKLKWGAATA